MLVEEGGMKAVNKAEVASSTLRPPDGEGHNLIQLLRVVDKEF